MSTQDGYAPYPVELTAAQTVHAIKRAFALDAELKGFVARHISADVPVKAIHGDFYSDNDRNFLAQVEGSNYLFIEM